MNKKNNYKIFIIAGEASGDLHGSGLMRSIKACNPNVSFSGLGGKKMEQQGVFFVLKTHMLGLKSVVRIENMHVGPTQFMLCFE